MEPALGGPTAYIGTVTIYGSLSADGSGAPALSHTAVFEAQAWRLSDRIPFRIFGACGELARIADGGTVTMNVPFWATGVTGLDVPLFGGKLMLVFRLPKDGAPATVSQFALAPK